MAEVDEITRKRELRRRKILENAESRLKKITGMYSNPEKPALDCCEQVEDDFSLPGISGNDLKNCSSSAKTKAIRDSDVFPSSNASSNSYSCGESFDDMSSGESSPMPVNGVYSSRSQFDESYTFPKKVSDAEARSFGRTRADSRRNSSCTQLMMERLHYSYFRFTVLRPWFVLFTGLLTRIVFALGYLSPSLENIFLPFAMLELALNVWMKLDPQVSSRQPQPSLISGALMLSGVSPSVIITVTSRLNTVKLLMLDMAVYIFSFVIVHFLFEKYFS